MPKGIDLKEDMDMILLKLLEEEMEIIEKIEKNISDRVMVLLTKKLALVTARREHYENLKESQYQTLN